MFPFSMPLLRPQHDAVMLAAVITGVENTFVLLCRLALLPPGIKHSKIGLSWHDIS